MVAVQTFEDILSISVKIFSKYIWHPCSPDCQPVQPLGPVELELDMYKFLTPSWAAGGVSDMMDMGVSSRTGNSHQDRKNMTMQANKLWQERKLRARLGTRMKILLLKLLLSIKGR